VCRYGGHLNETDKLRLVCDAIQRLQLFIRGQNREAPPAAEVGLAEGNQASA